MAAEEAAESAPQTSQAKAPGSGPGVLVLIMTAVNLIVTIGIIGLLAVNFLREKSRPGPQDIVMHDEGVEETGGKHGEGDFAKAARKRKDLDLGRMVTLDKFTVNLSTVGSVAPKYVIVDVSIEVATEDTETEVLQKMPQVRNTIIDLFNSKRSADMATVEGRNYLKDEIKNALNSFLVTGKVDGVFFTNFAVSS